MSPDEHPPLPQDDATLSFYSASAAAYVADGSDAPNPRLTEFLAGLPAGARILELGCGGGRDAAVMFAAGFDVDPTDGTPEIAREAALRLGRPVRVLRFDVLDAVAAYDGIWANASLLHVPRAGLPDVLARIHAALRSGGLHCATYKGGGTEGRDALGRYYNYLDAAQLRDVYGAAATWASIETNEYMDVGYDGRSGPWVAVTARRAVSPGAAAG